MCIRDRLRADQHSHSVMFPSTGRERELRRLMRRWRAARLRCPRRSQPSPAAGSDPGEELADSACDVRIRPIRSSISASARQTRSNSPRCRPSFAPVSYTHLDVYKRQGLRRELRTNLREAAGDGACAPHWRPSDHRSSWLGSRPRPCRTRRARRGARASRGRWWPYSSTCLLYTSRCV